MLAAALAILVTIFVLYVYYDHQKWLPGPWNLPIIGSLHKLDPVAPNLTLAKLAQKYGPIFRIKLGLVNIAVISEAKLLKKFLLKDETLGRPPLFILRVMFGGKGNNKNVTLTLFLVRPFLDRISLQPTQCVERSTQVYH